MAFISAYINLFPFFALRSRSTNLTLHQKSNSETRQSETE